MKKCIEQEQESLQGLVIGPGTTKKQESGGWEERFDKEFNLRLSACDCVGQHLKTSDEIKSFISTELQEAERRGYKKAFKDAEKLLEECDQRYDGFSWIMWDEGVNKLLKK